MSPEELEEVFEAPVVGDVTLPRWNVAPTQQAPVVVVDSDGQRAIRPLRWGLVPHWAEQRGPLRINARAESVAAHGAFREAFSGPRGRCLIPADGFYEWAKRGARKQPYWIHHRRGGLLGLAGLWERWRHAGETLESFTILTTAPNGVVAPLHNRMPVVLEPRAWAAWLDPATATEGLRVLLAPAPDDLLAARAVSSLVSHADVDDRRCVEPLGEERPELMDLFEGG